MNHFNVNIVFELQGETWVVQKVYIFDLHGETEAL